MNMEYIRALESQVTSSKRNLGDAGSVLPLLYEAYGDVNRIDENQIKADFEKQYQAMNEMPLWEKDGIITLVCDLCRNHERFGFIHGVQAGMLLAHELAKVSDCTEENTNV